MNQQVNPGIGGGRRLGSNLAVNVNIQTPENGSDQVIQWDPFKVTYFSPIAVTFALLVGAG